MRNELRNLIVEQGADMAGTHDPIGMTREAQARRQRGPLPFRAVRHQEKNLDVTGIAEGADVTARREAFLAHARFNSRRERAIYKLFAGGLSPRAIAAKMGRTLCVIQRVIARVERSIYADAFVPIADAPVWHNWLKGAAPSRVAQKCRCSVAHVNAVVSRSIKAWRHMPPAEPQAFVDDCDEDFVAKLGNLTPKAALEAAQRNPEIAEMLQRLGIAGGEP